MAAPMPFMSLRGAQRRSNLNLRMREEVAWVPQRDTSRLGSPSFHPQGHTRVHFCGGLSVKQPIQDQHGLLPHVHDLAQVLPGRREPTWQRLPPPSRPHPARSPRGRPARRELVGRSLHRTSSTRPPTKAGHPFVHLPFSSFRSDDLSLLGYAPHGQAPGSLRQFL
jgi:hypothetical protein